VVRELSDRIVVLHNGRLVADGVPAAVMASPIVQQAYLGLAPEDHDGAGATTETAVEGAGR
jgi:branched-chain amino acid transport system ATP-binding protein